MQPKLYNWVRAIRKISLISAIYSILVMASCATIYFAYYSANDSAPYPYTLLITVISTLLLTIALRGFALRKILNRFQSNFCFEILLATWCILLVLIHLECQLLFLMLFQPSLSAVTALCILTIGALVVLLTWPKLAKIQALLKDLK